MHLFGNRTICDKLAISYSPCKSTGLLLKLILLEILQTVIFLPISLVEGEGGKLNFSI